MVASPLVTSTRYMDVGTTQVYYLSGIASGAFIPTRAEMNAGINLSPELADWSGWVVESELLDVQNIGNPFKSMIPGTLSTPDSSLTLYASKDGIDIRSVLSRGTSGYVMFLDGGDAASHRAEVYPVTVAFIGLVRGTITSTTAGTDLPSQVQVSFAVTGNPALNVLIPV